MGTVSRIYFDMDGVLADFNKGLEEICHMTPKDQSESTKSDDDAIFGAIRNADHFYRRLDMVPGAKGLWDALYERFGEKCEILTGVPKPERNILEASGDKREWVMEKLSDRVAVHTVKRAEKKDYCKGSEYILIDDFKKNIDEWVRQGGTGILFKDADQALEDVLKYING